MPSKIGFTVVNSSSHEDNFSAKELLVHAPTVSGWRSSRLCSYPQHITLQLEERRRVRKLQLLAHQYMIPSKVEFHIGDTLHESSPSGFPGTMCRLGYVSLSDNEKTSFKARELKSVHVDAFGTYLRVTLHKNHVNCHNHFSQVALVAINVLGDSLDGNVFNTIPSREQLIEHYLNSTQQEAALDTTFMGKSESISPLDDLAFDMYHDPEVAHIIRLLDQKKRDMVHQERFEQAKHLKQAIADLQKVGEHLARYEVEKRCAIENEDYDLAKKKKQQMDEYRRRVYQQLEVYNLLDLTLIYRATDSAPAEDPPSVLPSQTHQSVSNKVPESTGSLKKMKKSNPPTATPTPPRLSSQPSIPCTPVATPRVNVTSMPYDERPLPALERKDRRVESMRSPAEENSPLSDVQSTLHAAHISGEPEPLTEKSQREAGPALEVFGETIVAAAYSKNWSYREDALMAVHQKLLEVSPSGSKDELRVMIRAAVFLVKKALLDKVLSVFQSSLKLLWLLLSQMIPGGGLGRGEVTHCLEQTWPNLLARTGDSASRLRLTALTFIQEMAHLKDVRALQWIPSELVKPFKSNFPCRLAQGRAELVERLLAALGTENSGFILDNVMTFCTRALEHSASVVRELAVHIILSMYKQHSGAVLNYLPLNDATARKNFLYKTLFDGFAKIDGTLFETLDRVDEGTKAQMSKKEAPKVEKEAQKTAGATASKASQIKTTQIFKVQLSVSNYLDNLCIFCGKRDDAFTEDGLDLHYWKHCPMLRRCDECKQVVETASLTEHLLGECENKYKFSHCPQCTEAVLTEDLSTHLQGPTCYPPSSDKAYNHCPLCHINLLPGEETWKAHLMGREGCKQNSRWTTASRRMQPAQGRAERSSKIKQSSTVGAGAQPMGRGSKIPALGPAALRTTPGADM